MKKFNFKNIYRFVSVTVLFVVFSFLVVDSANAAIGIDGTFTNPSMNGAWNSVVVGNYAYVPAADADCFNIVDVSVMSTPSLVGSICDAIELNSAYNVVISGNYAFVTVRYSNRLTVIDISVKSAPEIKTSITHADLNTPVGIDISGNYAFITLRYLDGVTAVDISDPLNPFVVSSLKTSAVVPNTLEGAWDIKIVDDLAYVTARDGHCLTIVDIQDPLNMFVVGSVQDSLNMDTAYNVDIDGDYAYVTARYGDSFNIINIQDPLVPVLVSTLFDPVNNVFDGAKGVKVFGDMAYVTGFDANSLVMIDIFDKNNPFIFDWIIDGVNLNRAYGLSFKDGYAYVSYAGGGFSILSGIPDTTSPTLITEAWIPDDTTGTKITDGGTVDLEDIDEAVEFITIYSDASDASGILDQKIKWWRYDDEGTLVDEYNNHSENPYHWKTTTTPVAGGLNSLIINGPLNDGDIIEYQSQATDNASTPNTAYDPAESIRYSFAINSLGSNTPPTQPTVQLTPLLQASSTSDLTCAVTTLSTDTEGDSMTYTYEWIKDGVLQGGLTVTNSVAISDVLDSNETLSGENWQCQVTPNDGTENGQISDISNSVLTNTLPVISSIIITSDNIADDTIAYTNNVLIANPNASDVDTGDSISFIYEWKDVVSGLVVDGNNQTISSANYSKNDQIQVTVIPNDGIEDGAPLTSEIFTISNSAPTEPDIFLSPAGSVGKNENITCSISTVSTDVDEFDGDVLTYKYEWLKNNVVQGGFTEVVASTVLSRDLNFINTSVDDVWKCRVTPSDDESVNGPTAESAEVTVINNLPTVPTISVSPNPAYEDDDLFCSATDSTDVDGDAIIYNYEWFVDDGTGYVSSGIVINNVSFSDTMAGEDWKCVVTPNDGIVDGLSSFGETTILELPFSDFPSVMIEAEDENGDLINNGVSIDVNLTDSVTITSSASDDVGIFSHKILFTDNNWASTYYDTDTATPCGGSALCSINICDKLACPLPVDTVIKYKSEATDTDAQTIYSDENLFRAIAIVGPNNPPSVSGLSVIYDYCAKDLEDISFSWNFSDSDEHDQNPITDLSVQTAFEITIDYGAGPCSTGIIEDTRTSASVALINSSGSCLNVIQYGRSSYDWTVTVYDSFDASDSAILNDSLNNMPNHKKPIADFSHLPSIPVLLEDITFDPLNAPDNSVCFDSSNNPVDCLTFEWDFDNNGSFEGDSDPADPTEIYFYSSTGTYIVDLKVTDTDNYSCFASDRSNHKTINIGYGNPEWEEIAPHN